MKSRNVFSLSVLAMALGQTAYAAEEVQALDDVVVTATRTKKLTRDVPASVSVINSKTIEKSSATTVDQLLQGIPGVYAARMDSSSPNRIAQTYTRGLPGSGRTLVMLDGVQMNVLFDGQVDWSQLSVQDVERVEVVRGASSGLYGGNAMGGVINIISKQPKPGTVAKVGGEYGTHNTKRFSASLSAASETTGFYASANRLTSDGYDMWTQASKTAAGVNASKLIAIGTEKTNFTARLSRNVGDQSKAALNLSYLDDISTGFYAIPNYNPQQRKQLMSSLDYKFFSDNTESSLQLYGRFGKQYADSTAAPYTAITSHGTYDDKEYGLKGQSSITLSDSQQLTLGAAWRDGSIAVLENGYTATPTRVVNRNGYLQNLGLFAQDEIRYGTAWKFNAAARWDKWSTNGSLTDTLAGQPTGVYPKRSGTEFSPKLGVLYSITDNVNLRATAGKSFKLAELTEMYSSNKRGTVTYWGNPNLKPERVNAYDFGLDYYFAEATYAKATLYRNDARDFVYSVTRDATNNDKVNIESVVTQGVELEGRYKPHEFVALNASYTYNDSTIKQSTLDMALVGKQLVNVPKHQAQLRAEIDLSQETACALSVNYVGDRASSDKNTTAPYHAYTTYDASLSMRFTEAVRASLAVVNIGNNKYEGIGYMAPGRLVSAGLSAQF